MVKEEVFQRWTVHGDGSPPEGSRGGAPVEGLGDEFPQWGPGQSPSRGSGGS